MSRDTSVVTNVPSALLQKGRNGQLVTGVARAIQAQEPSPLIHFDEIDIGDRPPHPMLDTRTLDPRDIPAKTLSLDHPHSSGVLSGDEDEGRTGRRLGAPHVLRRLADVRVELDPTPAEGERLERGGTLQEAELVRGGHETLPAPSVFLTLGRPLVGKLDGGLERVECHVERDHDLGVLREVGRGVRADPGELVDREALLHEAQHGGLEDVRRGVEDVVDELELGVGLELLHPPGHELVVAEKLLDHLDGSSKAEEAVEELDHLPTVNVRQDAPQYHL